MGTSRFPKFNYRVMVGFLQISVKNVINARYYCKFVQQQEFSIFKAATWSDAQDSLKDYFVRLFDICQHFQHKPWAQKNSSG